MGYFGILQQIRRGLSYAIFRMNFVPIPSEWVDYLKQQGETGMGYQVVSVTLKDGRNFRQVVASEGFFTKVRGFKGIPFTAQDAIASVKVTHRRWKFSEE